MTKAESGAWATGITDDVVMAHQNSDGTFDYHVWSGASTCSGSWYHSNQFSMALVAGRLVAGDW